MTFEEIIADKAKAAETIAKNAALKLENDLIAKEEAIKAKIEQAVANGEKEVRLVLENKLLPVLEKFKQYFTIEEKKFTDVFVREGVCATHIIHIL